MTTEETTTERWLPVPGWGEFYSVSDRGRVRRDARARSTASWPGKILKPRRTRTGYVAAALYGSPGVRRERLVHQLVLSAFVGPRPPGHEPNHKNYDRTDNRLDNLEYMTPKQNQEHRGIRQKALGHPNRPRGEAYWNAKLTTDDVREIRRRHSAGEGVMALARAFAVTRHAINYVYMRRTWKHVA